VVDGVIEADFRDAGMDPNVVGRPLVQKRPAGPRIRRIYVRDLTPESEGNAIGIAMADFTARRLVEKINYKAMYINAITGGSPDAVKVPMVFETDREAIEVALGMIAMVQPEPPSIVRIQNTLLLAELDVSDTLLPAVKAHPRLTVVGDAAPLAFDGAGNLMHFNRGSQ
jgi:hypothetical protein